MIQHAKGTCPICDARYKGTHKPSLNTQQPVVIIEKYMKPVPSTHPAFIEAASFARYEAEFYNQPLNERLISRTVQLAN